MMRFISFILLLTLFSCSSPGRKIASHMVPVGADAPCGELILALFPRPKRVFVKSPKDFLKHTRLHIQRVQAMGDYLIHRYPDQFDQLDPASVNGFLRLHDQGKVNFDLSHDDPILLQLYEFYGIPNHLLTEAQIEQRFSVVRHLNDIDDKVGQDFLRSKGWLDADGKPNEAGKQMLLLEKMADFTDRFLASVSPEEFGRKTYSASGQYEGFQRQMVLDVETHYSEITAGLEYPMP